MSATMAGGSPRIPKTTCRKCKRTVYVVSVDRGAGSVETVQVDPELINVVPFAGAAAVTFLARRVHGELCLSYQLAAEREVAKAKLRGVFGVPPKRPR